MERHELSCLACFVLVALMFLLVPTMPAFSQSIGSVKWDIAGVGVDPRTAEVDWNISFTVNVDDLPLLGTVYVGCTFVDDEGEEHDLDATAVNLFRRRSKFLIRRIPSYARGVIFTLWRRKITEEILQGLSSEEYQRAMSSSDPGEFADQVRRLEEKGYFLYDRIDSTGWIDLTEIEFSESPLGGTLIAEGVAVSAAPNVYTILYKTDFSSDPAWSTNSPNRYRWDSDTATYFTDNYTNSGEWATKTIGYNGESFRLQFDVMPTERGTGDVCVGLFDAQKLSHSSGGEKVFVLLGGYSPVFYLEVKGTSGEQAASPAYELMQVHQWHHFELIYYSGSNQLTFTGSVGEDQVTWQGTVIGGFSADLDYLGVSMNGTWATTGRQEVAYVDNVVIEIIHTN